MATIATKSSMEINSGVFKGRLWWTWRQKLKAWRKSSRLNHPEVSHAKPTPPSLRHACRRCARSP
eukprot:5756699-Alexandrium_andersonii.AAC.1